MQRNATREGWWLTSFRPPCLRDTITLYIHDDDCQKGCPRHLANLHKLHSSNKHQVYYYSSITVVVVTYITWSVNHSASLN